MDFGCAGLVEDGLDVAFVDPAAGHDSDPSGSLLHETGDDFCAVFGGGASAGGEDAADAQTDKFFQGGGQIGGHIERPMEGEGQRVSQPHQLAGAGEVNAAIREKDAADDSGCASVAGGEDIELHGFEVNLRIAKITFAGANQNIDWDAGVFDRMLDHAHGRCGATEGKYGAEFHPVGAGLRGGKGGLRRVGAHFKQDGMLYGCPPCGRRVGSGMGTMVSIL